MPLVVSSISEGQPWLIDLGACTSRAQQQLATAETIVRLIDHAELGYLFINITVTTHLPHYYLVNRGRVRKGRDASYIVSIHESACVGTDEKGLTDLVLRACAIPLFDVAKQSRFDLETMSSWLSGLAGKDRFETP